MGWGAVAAAALPFVEQGLEFVSAKQAFDRAKYVSNRQMASAQFVAENQPSWATEGLRKAGWNPILAATRGMPSAEFAPRQSAPPMKVSGLSRSISSAREAMLMDAAVREANAKASEAETSARYADQRQRWMLNQVESSAFQASQSGYRQIRERDLIAAQILATFAGTEKTELMRKLMETELPSAEAQAEFYRDYPFMRSIGLLLKETKR